MEGFDYKRVIELAGIAIDCLGVFVMLAGMVVAGVRYTLQPARIGFRGVRRDLGRAILLGLEFLVAADIIRTVAVAPTLGSVLVLGLIVIIRISLSMALEIEREGRLPWQRKG